jgi:hypothetical protein
MKEIKMKIVALVCLLATGCSQVQESGELTTESRQTAPYKEIEVAGAFDISIKAGEEFSLSLTGDEKLVSQIETKVDGDTLVIKTSKRFNSVSRIRVEIGCPSLTDITVAGANSITIGQLNEAAFNATIAGASKMKLSGEVKTLGLTIAGASKVEATELKSLNAVVDVAGASKARLNATETLALSAAGVSSIEYIGSPRITQQTVVGVSEVKAIN